VRGRRTWRKLHLAVDAATNTIVAATLTTSSEGDASQVGPLLDQTTGQIDTIMADGAYDGEPTYQTVAEHDPTATVVIPPRSTAVLGSSAEPTQRDRHIQSLADEGRLSWQRETDYGTRSRAETAMHVTSACSATICMSGSCPPRRPKPPSAALSSTADRCRMPGLRPHHVTDQSG
jgi:transposase